MNLPLANEIRTTYDVRREKNEEYAVTNTWGYIGLIMSRGESYRTNTDEELMLKYQEDDSLAFSEIYDRTANRIQGYLQRRVQDKMLVDDILQGTFFKFHQTRDRYRPPLPVLPWLFTICQSVMIDALRSTERHKNKIKDIGADSLASGLATDQASPNPDQSLLDGIAGIKKLSSDQKQALELRYKDDMSFEEIGRRLETSPANVRQLISRALRRLKRVSENTRGEK